MAKVTPIGTRKADHIRINLEEDVRSGLTTGLENFRFIHSALPELNLEEISLKTSVFGKTLQAPLLISSMTGGSSDGGQINIILAQAAQAAGIAMGVGSQRVAIEQPEMAFQFELRKYAPDACLFANLGAIQLNYGFGLEQCKQAVNMLAADGLILHFNALQEAVQPGGDTRFAGLLPKIEMICAKLSVPVIAKEVGWGFSQADAIRLANAGVAAIDVAGAGGTSWSQVEMHRTQNASQRNLAAAFVDWGNTTSESIINVRNAAPQIKVFASGGLRNGIDVAKSIALGASIGGLARPFLKAAVHSLDAVMTTIHEISREIQVCMFAAGVPDIPTLQKTSLLEQK